MFYNFYLQEIGREFEKLIIGGNSKAQPSQTERQENDNSPSELVIDDTTDDTTSALDYRRGSIVQSLTLREPKRQEKSRCQCGRASSPVQP